MIKNGQKLVKNGHFLARPSKHDWHIYLQTWLFGLKHIKSLKLAVLVLFDVDF